MTALRESDRLRLLLDSLEILSPTRLRFGDGGEIEWGALPAMQLAPQPDSPHDPELRPLRDAVAMLIYFAAYARVYDGGQVNLDGLRAPVVADPAFVSALSTANAGATRWDRGWKIYQADANGAVHIQKGDVATLAPAGQYSTGGFGFAPRVGAYVEFLVPHESVAAQPGWYHAFGTTVMSDHDAGRIGRFYLHISADDAAFAIAALTSLLNRYSVPFRLKVPVDPRHFDRTDALVLYTPRRFVPIVHRLVMAQEEVTQRLLSGTPLFALELCRGLAAADDPGTGESFGQSRCRLIADAILDGGSRSGQRQAKIEALERRFRRAGLDPCRPHLASGLVERYAAEPAVVS